MVLQTSDTAFAAPNFDIVPVEQLGAFVLASSLSAQSISRTPVMCPSSFRRLSAVVHGPVPKLIIDGSQVAEKAN
jgi:hypothetical protein